MCLSVVILCVFAVSEVREKKTAPQGSNRARRGYAYRPQQGSRTPPTLSEPVQPLFVPYSVPSPLSLAPPPPLGDTGRRPQTHPKDTPHGNGKDHSVTVFTPCPPDVARGAWLMRFSWVVSPGLGVVGGYFGLGCGVPLLRVWGFPGGGFGSSEGCSGLVQAPLGVVWG